MTSVHRRSPRLAPLLVAVLATVAGSAAAIAQQPARTSAPAASPAAAHGRIVGVLVDSIRQGALARATVHVGTTGRAALSDDRGRFLVDSVPAGDHQVMVTHPLLDSLYLSITTRPVRVAADSVTELVVAVPSVRTFLGSGCTPAAMRLGPGVFVGRVLDADTKAPAPDVRVTLVWTQVDVGTDIGVRRMPRVRAATSDARGWFRICGVPSDIEDGTLLAERGRVKTAEVPIAMEGASVALRSLLVRAAGDTLTTGRALVTGSVVDTLGAPVANAQVSVEGASSVATTNPRGEFRLDSLPSGTQSLVVRRVGFGPSQTIVDLAATDPVHVAVRLGRTPPRLAPVVVTAQAEALSRVGFEERQKRGSGRYIGPEDLEKLQPQFVTSALRTMPGLRVVPAGARGSTVVGTRDATGGCVNFWVDGAPFKELSPGDLDATFPASSMAGIEVYQPGTAPPQFVASGLSSCTAVVIWTHASIRRKK